MKSNTVKAVSTKDIIKNVKALVSDAIKDSYGVSEIVTNGKKGKEESIIVTLHNNQTFDIDAKVVMAPGVKITEALYETQKIVKYRVDKAYPKLCNKVNVYAIGISSK